MSFSVTPPRVTKRKQPSGQQNRIKRRQREQELAEREERRAQASDGSPTFKQRSCPDITRVHLFQLERLQEAQDLIVSDEAIPRDERARFILATTHAMAKINVQAQLEQDVETYKAALLKREDELVAAQAATLSEKQRYQQARSALIAACEAKGLPIPPELQANAVRPQPN